MARLRLPVLAATLALALTLAACGRPDASGLYVSTADRQVTLIQLTQAKDGAVTGRLEDNAIGPGGIVSAKSTALEGSVAKHDLTVTPAGAGPGGQVSGTFARDAVSLGGIRARRATLKDYQTALTRLQSRAAAERRKVADAQEQQGELAAKASAIGDGPDQGARLDAAAAALRADTEKLNAGADAAPDFGRQSADNTARVAQLAQQAKGASGQARSQLIQSAGQAVIATTQIGVARAQYVVPLNQFVQQAAPLATEVQRFCDSPEAKAVARQCAGATSAATDFQSALVHAVTLFNRHKRSIQDDLARQNELLRQMGG